MSFPAFVMSFPVGDGRCAVDVDESLGATFLTHGEHEHGRPFSADTGGGPVAGLARVFLPPPLPSPPSLAALGIIHSENGAVGVEVSRQRPTL